MANLQVGTIRKSKKGNLYINLNQTKNKKGDYTSTNLEALKDAIGEFIENPENGGLSLFIEKPQDKLTRLAELGYIEEADLERRLENIPSYIKYEITLSTED